MSNSKSFSVWLAVKLMVKVETDADSESPWIRDAVVRGADWLTTTVREASENTPDIIVTRDAVDLTDVAVKVLNQRGEEREAGALDKNM